VGKWTTPEGAYRRTIDRQEAVWASSLVLFLQASQPDLYTDVQKTAAYLVSLQGRLPDPGQAAEVSDIDLTLIGWPWADGNFSWVEPTAWACLALRRAGYENHSRVVEGLRLLRDRVFEDGGANYGNRSVLGRRTEPIPGPSALTLLALQGHGKDQRVAATVSYLLQQSSVGDDAQHLCWTKLALDCHRDQPGVCEYLPALDERIVAAHKERADRTWLNSNPLLEALPALALGCEKSNPFRLSTDGVLGQVSSPDQCLPFKTKRLPRRPRWGERVASKFRGLAVEAIGRLRQIPAQTAVHIAGASDYNADLAGVLRRQYEFFRERVPLAGKRVVLKPNLVEYHRDKVINTHPHVVAAAIELCKSEGAAEILVAEGPGHWRNVEYLVQASGLGDVLRHYNVKFTDLNHDEPIKTPNLGRLTGLEYLYLSRTVACADVLISLPKLKTHHWAGVTLSLKNLFGTLPGICYGWPKNELHWRGIENSIVDIALTRTPDLAIVDGIIGMEGDGPLNGSAKPLGALIMGPDPVAVDAACCRLMELDPGRIKHLALAEQRRLGILQAAQVRQIGESIESFCRPFETVAHFHELRAARSA
jgi:uncharacterized protein (DUF362 family)